MDQFTVVWNGTRAAACGTRYLMATEEPPRDPRLPRPPGMAMTDRVTDALEASGPKTVRELAQYLDAEFGLVNGALHNRITAGVVRAVGQREVGVRHFGPRLVAVYDVVRRES